ncbi:phospholipase-like protein [Tanacetum coccineum]
MLGWQIYDENDNENVPLYYHINKDFSIPFGREEFCLETGLRFGVQNWAEYDTKQRIPFRRRVFPSYLDGQPITGIDIANMILDESFAQLYDDDAVGLCCLGILQLVILGVESKRVVPDWMLRLANDRVAWDKYPWGSYVWPSFVHYQLRNAKSNVWCPCLSMATDEDDSKKYSLLDIMGIQGILIVTIGILEGFLLCLGMSKRIKHYGLIGGFTQFQSTQGGPSSFQGHVNSSYFNMGTPPNFQTPMQSHVPSHMGRQNLQTTIETHDDVDGIFYQNILNRGRREQFPSKYKLTPFMEQPPTTILPKERVNKTKNKGKKANLSPLNLGGAFEDDNVEENNVTFLGSQFTGIFLMYENVDPSKVRRGNYVNIPDFLNAPHQIYLDCYMKGYIVPVSFWQQLVPHFCMSDMHRLPHGTPIGWLSGEHMNSWMKLCIRRRNVDANWTVDYTSTISIHSENIDLYNLWTNLVLEHWMATTRLYPQVNDVDSVFMPIHVAGNHWATGVIHLPSSHFYVFDSMYNEQNKDVLSRLIQCWTPVVNNILADRGCINETRPPHNFQYSYNDGLGIDVPQQTNFSDCGVITCWLISRLCAEIKPVVRGNTQQFFEKVRNDMCESFYMCRCEDTRECGYD